ncbi:MAG: hypothetical protein AAFQ87_14475, partial [Bacteroidota bacterium]
MIWDNWQALATEIGLSDAQTDEMATLFRHHYGEQDRHYHNLSHIEALLRGQATWPEPWTDPQAVKLSIWFHDIIYQPQRRDNELQSARFAERFFSTWPISNETAQKVVAMIEATAGHKAVGLDEDGRAFLDLDLSILGSDAVTYDAYTQAIRKEYRRIPGILYRPGRRKILRSFLER